MSTPRLVAVISLSLATSLAQGAFADSDLPSSIDLRPKFEHWNLTNRLQGKRGTCSVFAIAGAVEFAAAHTRGEGQRFSVEFLNWSGNQVIGKAKDGGFFSDLWSGYSKYGICSENSFPYRAEFLPANDPPGQTITEATNQLSLQLQEHWIKKWNVKTGLTKSQFTAIKRTLSAGWPVCAGCRWPNQPRWSNGVLQMCAPEAVFDGHSVLLIGYRDDPTQPGGGSFLLRDSNHRGRERYMCFEYARAYVNDAIWIDSQPAQSAQSK
jgi:C1A family cysteine protease